MSSPDAGKLLRAAAVLAAVVFSIVALIMGGVIASGIKDSEVPVVTLYTLFTALAAAASIASVVLTRRLAPLICVFAVGAATSAYVLEDALRTQEAAGAAFGLITVPLLIAVFVAIAIIRSGRRERGAPRAKLLR